MGNEVSLKTPWMYAFAGAPWKTQRTVRQILSDLYSNSPGGLPGNDDGGVLSSWYVFAALGVYPQISGVGGLVVGSPVFSSATIRLGNGGELRLAAPDSAGKPYIQSLRINGQDYASAWIPWKLLSGGGTIDFVMGESPNKTWGNQAGTEPPSFDDH
jgi:putative alpha-1,2-mannosidase